MRTIKESIIGRRGAPLRETWIIFPMCNDYRLALDIFPEEYIVRANDNYLFCIDDVQLLKRYFKCYNNKYPYPFSDPNSKLCVIKPSFRFKKLNQIKDWIRSIAHTDDVFQSPYVDVIEDVQKYIETL